MYNVPLNLPMSVMVSLAMDGSICLFARLSPRDALTI
jgi:hypothetical protein